MDLKVQNWVHNGELWVAKGGDFVYLNCTAVLGKVQVKARWRGKHCRHAQQLLVKHTYWHFSYNTLPSPPCYFPGWMASHTYT